MGNSRKIENAFRRSLGALKKNWGNCEELGKLGKPPEEVSWPKKKIGKNWKKLGKIGKNWKNWEI